MNNNNHAAPLDNSKGLVKYWKQDLLAGFLVFLIALPLCLAIAAACGYPPIAGIFTAVIGGVIAPFISNSELTIKGPAAGLIVIAVGCVTDFGGADMGRPVEFMAAYRIALGIGVAAGILQILFAIFRSGILGEFFPTSAVHGMLAAIGIIIIAKQLPIALGVGNSGEPWRLLLEMPQKFAEMNPEIALIGGISLAILFTMSFIKNKYVKMIPAPMLVLLVAIPLGMYFDLSHEHRYTFFLNEEEYELGERYLVDVPPSVIEAITTPDFSGLATTKGWYWVMMFALIGSLESILSAKAIDTLDPWRRKSSMDRDLLAVGVGNTLAALVGGLPMISEIVRSRANIDNGARTRLANMFHGLFLLSCVSLIPSVLHQIPLAALAAMLVFTGYRLASPREFVNTYKIGREQFIIFASTVVATLATDLLIGIAIGIAVKFLIHINNVTPLLALFKPYLRVDTNGEGTYVVKVRHFAVFSNWILLRKTILSLEDGHTVILDLAETRLVDHTVMEKLHELEHEFAQMNRKLTVVGLDRHSAISSHPHSARLMNADNQSSATTNGSATSTILQEVTQIGDGASNKKPPSNTSTGNSPSGDKAVSPVDANQGLGTVGGRK